MPRTRTAALVLAAAALPGLAGCAGTTPVAAVGADAPAGVQWHDCEGAVPAGVECATLDVPVDWDDPGGRTIALTLARAPKTGNGPAKGTVIAHFGGPGTALLPSLERVLPNFAGLRADMDLVTWNPRGSSAGDHLPPDVCFPGPSFDPPDDRREYAALAERNTEAMRACRDADPDVFDHMDSGTQARDMEAVRAAVGAAELNFFGNSYAGAIGASYARRYPEKVRTMYLDSSVDQVSALEHSDRGYEAAVAKTFGRFAEWCGGAADCALHGQDVTKVWRGLTAAADRAPIPVPDAGPASGLDGDELKNLAANLLLRPERWPGLAKAVERAADGDASLFDPQGRGAPPLPSGSAATQCADGYGYGGYGEYAGARARAKKEFPAFGGHRAAFATLCAGWPTPVANPHRALPGKDLPPFLGVGGVMEQSAVRGVVEKVPGSVQIRYDVNAHGVYANFGDACVIAHADRYLVDGVLPPKDTDCTPDDA